ncbi:globin-coupled sensor protein [Heliobacterium chlorum]|uniref:Globin-coupled sensor protein n=1 Tax=Heliobacterium chlorum TaxID=2698 RepID=A0ABR7T432_HELCL|nr:globin-coupled sensor protein [Heliobacterium chlorum]MBC9784436.1 globin-coupled sensor protein [Heliobacterium chlorum]
MFWRKASENTGLRPYSGPKPTIAIQNPSFQLSVRFMKLNPEQMELLQEIRPIIEKHVDEAVDVFYGHLGSIPEMREFITRHSTVERLKKTMRAYLLSLAPLRLDDDYAANRHKIGEAHDRIDLPPYWYTSAYQLYYNFFIPKIMDAYTDKDRAKAAITALLTITNLDQQLVMSSYLDSYTSGLSKKEELEKILGDLQSLQEKVNDASQGLAATAEETAASAAHMSSSAERITQNVSQAAKHTDQVVHLAQNGEKQLRESVQAIKDLTQLMLDMKSKISALDESSEKISSIAEVIQGIASQTNLLALNAAIESARAGEHGRGFNVVAQEVKKLASSSEQSVQEIAEMIQLSRTHTAEVSQAMEQNSHSMERVNQLVDKVVQGFTQILESIASNQEQMQQVTEEVMSLSSTAHEIENASEAVAHSAEDLSMMSHQLS